MRSISRERERGTKKKKNGSISYSHSGSSKLIYFYLCFILYLNPLKNKFSIQQIPFFKQANTQVAVTKEWMNEFMQQQKNENKGRWRRSREEKNLKFIILFHFKNILIYPYNI